MLTTPGTSKDQAPPWKAHLSSCLYTVLEWSASHIIVIKVGIKVIKRGRFALLLLPVFSHFCHLLDIKVIKRGCFAFAIATCF